MDDERELQREIKRLERRRDVNDPELIVLGFDGSKGRTRGIADACALVGLRLSDGRAETLGLWEPDREEYGWEAPRAVIAGRVHELFMTGKVVGFRGDPAGGWGDELATWENTYKPLVWSRYPFSIGARTPQAFAEFHDAIKAGKLHIDPADQKLRQHLEASRAADGTVQKEHSGPNAPRIDLAAGLAYARMAALDALAARPQKPPKTGRMMSV